MIILTASKSCLTASRRELLVEGAVNVNIVQFVFSSDWDGLTKTAVFQAGSDKYSVLLDESNEAPIPWEVLQNPRRTLYAGVYGTNGESLVLPTIWTSLGIIQEGANPGQDTQPPTPDVYSQILQVAKDAEDVAQSVRDDADSGKFNGEQGPTGPQGYTYTPAVSEEGVISWANDGGLPNPSPVNIKGPQGKQGIQGVQGKQGERGYVYTPNVSQDGIISWTNDGDLENPDPVDIRGPVGPQGGQGEQGIQGPRGYTYTPSVGEDGTVRWTNDGNLPNPDPVNITGPQGETGETPDITAGTVETLEPGQDATAEITGETPNLVLNLGIPKGQPGQDAPQIDDDVVSATNPWSSLKIVDALAPPFSSSGAIVTCNPVAGYPLHVVSQITPVQEGEGDPTPDNVRPISGWTEATLTHNDTPITLSFGQIVYGGELDWTTGVLTVTWKEADLNDPHFYPTGGNGIRFDNALDGKYLGGEGLCNYGKIGTRFTSGTVLLGTSPGVSSVYFVGLLDLLGLSSVEEYIQWAQTNKITIIYKTQNPFTVQLTPQEILALSGTNTIYTDTGDTTVSGRADPNTIIQQLATRIAALEEQAING